MPNLWAHIQFGRELASEFNWSSNMENLPWKASFQLGCQGPDFLFYDHFLPWQSETALNHLGSLMHNLQCGPFLLDLFNEVRGRPLNDPAVAYVLGFLLHHILDRNLHPYIFSRSGFKRWNHQRFETAMDAAVLAERAGICTGTTPVVPEIDTGGRLPGGMAEPLCRLASKHYPGLAAQLTPDRLDQAAKQFVSAQRLFYDPHGWKTIVLFGQIAPFSPPRKEVEWDVLNRRKESWIHPADRTDARTESAIELWEIALEDGRRTIEAGVQWLSSASTLEELERREVFSALLQNLSYETGMTCGEAWITYAESII